MSVESAIVEGLSIDMCIDDSQGSVVEGVKECSEGLGFHRRIYMDTSRSAGSKSPKGA
jgi:hypothetical protein